MVTRAGTMVSLVTGHMVTWAGMVMSTTWFIGHWPIGLKSIEKRDICLLNANEDEMVFIGDEKMMQIISFSGGFYQNSSDQNSINYTSLHPLPHHMGFSSSQGIK